MDIFAPVLFFLIVIGISIIDVSRKKGKAKNQSSTTQSQSPTNSSSSSQRGADDPAHGFMSEGAYRDYKEQEAERRQEDWDDSLTKKAKDFFFD